MKPRLDYLIYPDGSRRLGISHDKRTPQRHKAPKGECLFCDQERAAGNDFHPPHDASPRCESGKRDHCTCDICF